MSIMRRFLKLTFAERLVISLWVALLVGVVVRVAVQQPHKGTVYPVYYSAAKDWLEGRDLYALDWATRYCYRYWPGMAILFCSLEPLPQKVGGVLWRLLGAAIFLYAMRRCQQTLIPNIDRFGSAIFWGLLIPFALQSYNNAQINMHLIGLLMLGLVYAREDRRYAAGVCVGLATLFKIYPIAFAAVLLVTIPRRFAVTYFGVILAGAALPFLVGDFEYVRYQYGLWFEYLGHDSRHGGTLFHENNKDFLMLVRVIFDRGISESIYPPIQLLSAAVVGGWTLLALRKGIERNRILLTGFHLSCVWMTVFGPSTESATYTILGPTAAATAVMAWQGSRGTKIAAVLAIAMLLAPTLVAAVPGGRMIQTWALQPAGGLIIAGLVLHQATGANRQRQSESDDSAIPAEQKQAA